VPLEQYLVSFIPWNSQPLDAWAEKHAPGRFIDLDGRRTHYVERGSGEPIILVHGFFYDTFTWHNNIEALSEHFRVIAPDLWGFGYSTREPLEYGYPLFAEQLLQFMDGLGVEKASIVGHSMGGGSAIYFALHHADRVNKLMLVGSAGMPNPLPLLGKLTNLPHVGEWMFGLQNDFFRKTALKTNWIHENKLVTDSYFEHVTQFHKVTGTTEVLLSILRKNFIHTLGDEVRALGELEMPTLITWGTNDAAVPLARGYEMHELMPSSTLEVFDDVGHCPHDESPDRFNSLSIDFMID
jgi:pimeloyl-ACP methyl ester carboxylesterase